MNREYEIQKYIEELLKLRKAESDDYYRLNLREANDTERSISDLEHILEWMAKAQNTKDGDKK